MKASVVSKVIRERRSVFPANYSLERVDDSIVAEMLENANWAPTHKLTQPWRFTVFTKGGLQILGLKQAEIYKEVSQRKGGYSDKKYNDLKAKPLKASHVIAIGMKRDDAKRIPAWEEISSVAAAVQNMCLTAASYDIGCYWATGGITGFEESKEYFSLKEDDKLMGFLFVGMPASILPDGKRQPISDRVTWVNS